MSEAQQKASDEPTRIRNIIVPAFADEAQGWATALANGACAKLEAGVLAQDDCAVFSLDGKQDLVMGSDYIRGSKFRLYELGYLDNFDVGYYLAIANFSDIAAMGAQPIALLSVIRYPKLMLDSEFRIVVEGISAACAEVGARNVGGDIGTAERMILSASAMGVVEPGRALRRDGANPGDLLCITGPTGVAGATQQYFYQVADKGHELDPEVEERLIRSWRRPKAQVQAGRVMSVSGLVTSCQDTSDGLKAAIESLGNASDVGFVIDEKDLPVDGLVHKVAMLRGLQTLDIVFGDSVDFQLLFTVSPDEAANLRGAFSKSGLDFFCIGTAKDQPDIVIRSRDGSSNKLPGEAWRHAT